MVFSSKVYTQPNGQKYKFCQGDFYEWRKKVWYCVDHIYTDKYRKIADEIKTQEQKQ